MSLTRRRLLGAGVMGVGALGAGVAGLTGIGGCGRTDGGERMHEVTYGEDASQFAELTLPESGSVAVGVAVVIHGGFWRSSYGLDLGRPLATSLVAHGWAALNIEYRRVGNGGGYPETFDDVSAAIDLLAGSGGDVAREAGFELDLGRVVTIGHSAGGHLAAWAATRTGQETNAPGSDPAVPVIAVVSQAGVLDLRGAAAVGLGGDAAQELLGGGPQEVPERYDVASPIERLPIGVPALCVHGLSDRSVPIAQSQDFVAAAIEAGDNATLEQIPGDHFDVIDPDHASWRTVLDWIATLP